RRFAAHPEVRSASGMGGNDADGGSLILELKVDRQCVRASEACRIERILSHSVRIKAVRFIGDIGSFGDELDILCDAV
nr:hypothetical protein [Tanacetum cinerariifolium]